MIQKYEDYKHLTIDEFADQFLSGEIQLDPAELEEGAKLVAEMEKEWLIRAKGK